MALRPNLSQEELRQRQLARFKERFAALEMPDENRKSVLRYDSILANNGRSLAYRVMFIGSIVVVVKAFLDKKFLDITEDEFLAFFDNYRNSTYSLPSKVYLVARNCLEKREMSLDEIMRFSSVSKVHARTIVDEVILKYAGFEKDKRADTVYLKALDYAKVPESKRTFRAYSPQTVSNIIGQIKPFFRFINGGEMPVSLKNIKQGKPVSRVKEGEVLSPEEVRMLIESANHPRDKCMLSLLYETGCRILKFF